VPGPSVNDSAGMPCELHSREQFPEHSDAANIQTAAVREDFSVALCLCVSQSSFSLQHSLKYRDAHLWPCGSVRDQSVQSLASERHARLSA
jgi:hypothetical protein